MNKKGKSKKKELLSDKISSLFTVAPSADIEDDQVFGTKPKTVTRDDFDSDNDLEESALSNFKKRSVALLSELSNKYAGEITSRKELHQSEDDDSDVSEDTTEEKDDIEEEDSENLSDSLQNDEDDSMNDQSDTSEEEKNSSNVDSNDGEASEDGFDLSQMDAEKDQKFTHFKETDHNEETKKGNCVKNQLSLWESLLEMRIGLQKCLITANKMPLSETFQELKKHNGDEFTNSVGKTKGHTTNLLTKLLDLQSQLLGQYPETKKLLSNNNSAKENKKNQEDDDDEEISSDSDSVSSEKDVPEENMKPKKRKLSDFSDDLAKRHTLYSKYRNTVIQKWHDKTKLNVAHGKNQPVSSTLSQIEYLLKDKNRLIRRTQLKRSKYDIVGQISKEETEEIVDFNTNESQNNLDDDYCPEIFDDDDFYHQLLRELIECKSADISDPIQLSRQWISLQQMRSKMKRKIDTKATKGRRIRYSVHSKLVNFMAPQKALDWTDDSKNELFASLFGKQFEKTIDNHRSDNTNEDVDMKIF